MTVGMLPVYRAISFHGVYDKKNRTKPWLVLVNTGQDLKPYVVKLFSTQQIKDHDSVTKEVLGNVLAREFDLPVPKAALIDLGDDFIRTIRDQQLLEEIESKDFRLKFGTEEQKGVVPFQRSLTYHDATQHIDIDSLFAFDCLIRNVDRSRGNPNLLIKSKEAFLIDHELAFNITDKSASEITDQWFLPEKFFRYHMFIDYLKHRSKQEKKEFFHTFEELLRRLNVNVLKTHFDQLTDAGFSQKNHNLIVEYLKEMKLNSSIFVKILKGLIDG